MRVCNKSHNRKPMKSDDTNTTKKVKDDTIQMNSIDLIE